MTATLLGQTLGGALILHQIFVMLLLATRREARKDHSAAMIVFFGANLLASVPELVGYFWPQRDVEAEKTASAALILLLGPSVFFYCRALVSPEVLVLQRRDLWHLAPFGLALGLGGLVIALRDAIPQANAVPDVITPALAGQVIAHVGLFALYVGVTSWYFLRVMRLLWRYRRSKYDYFASFEGRSLTWIEWMIALLSLIWLVTLALLAVNLIRGSSPLTEDALAVFEAVWVYALSFMVLWQQEIFLPHRQRTPPVPEDTEEPELAPEGQRPRRSTLDEARLSRICGKIDRAMRVDRLYRNQNITLRHLSDHTRVSENHLSEVLNGHLGRNFYEFINHWRVQDACALLAQADAPVIAIGEEVGFNSRSTFYTAFKRETGVTPSEFRATALAAS